METTLEAPAVSLFAWNIEPVAPLALDLFLRLRRKDYEMRPVALDVARSLVESYHYARGGSTTGVYVHGLFHRAYPAECLGVAWWLPPMPGAARMVCPDDWRRVLQLHRFVISPHVPKNAATYLLGASIRHIRRAGRFVGLLTYADEGQGHRGTIYRASNWGYLGQTTARHPGWLDPETGRLVCIKSGGNTRTRAAMRALGLLEVAPTPKHRFSIVFA